MSNKSYQNIDAYISEFPIEVVAILNLIRNCIQDAAPIAKETISYNMPAFKYKTKILVYFAAFKNHIGFYALPSGNTEFHEELSTYKTGKGSIQFPLDKDIPFGLISKIVKFRIKEIDES